MLTAINVTFENQQSISKQSSNICWWAWLLQLSTTIITIYDRTRVPTSYNIIDVVVVVQFYLWLKFFSVSRVVVMCDDEIGTEENKHLTKAKSQPHLFGVTWSKVDIFNVLSVSLWKRSLYERRTMSTQIKNKYLPLRLSTRILWNSLGEVRWILNHVDYKFRNKSRLYKLFCK